MALLGLTLSVHLLRQKETNGAVPAIAFDHLVRAADLQGELRQAALADAEVAFRRGVGSVWIEPLALIGLSLVIAMPTELGRPVAPEPAELSGDERAALAHGRSLLERGHPRAALAWITRARTRHPTSEPMQQLQMFADLWVAARHRALRQAPER